MPVQLPKLLEKVRKGCQAQGYSNRTEEIYTDWVRRFILFHDSKDPRDFGVKEVNRFLSHMDKKGKVGPSTRNQAYCALMFLHKHVLQLPEEKFKGVTRTDRSKAVPVILSRPEILSVLSELHGQYNLMGLLLYGAGLRLLECLKLRVKDIDWRGHHLLIRGVKDRKTILPLSLEEPLREHLLHVREIHKEDLKAGYAGVELTEDEKWDNPGVEHSWPWQYVFPSRRLALDPNSGLEVRHHANGAAVSREITAAVRRAGLKKRASAHSLRHSFAMHLLEDGYEITKVQELLGHADLNTTMAYARLLEVAR